ncbi:MAG: hypothetical protein M3463_00970 [Verrucomicrobiota bacterium]|nr:hypothetical protein [Verrucomicrobiota bacterium]
MFPRFTSANIHRGLDGDKVVNYAQWRSVDYCRAMMKNPAATPQKISACFYWLNGV